MKDSTKHATLAKAERFLEQLEKFTENMERSLDKARDDAEAEIDQRRHELKKAKLAMQEDLKKLKADTHDNWESLYEQLSDSARKARKALEGLNEPETQTRSGAQNTNHQRKTADSR